MCGIFGIVTQDEQPLGPILIEEARRLTYRGYDSVGAVPISGSKIERLAWQGSREAPSKGAGSAEK